MNIRPCWKTFYNVERPRIYTNSTPMRHGKAWICVELYERVKVEIKRYYEPHATQLWDSCRYTHEEEREFLEKHKLSYYYIAQFSHYVLPGAKRIAATCYTDKLETVSFVNPDGTLAVVLLNRTEQGMPVTLRIKGSLIACEIEASSMTTIVLN